MRKHLQKAELNKNMSNLSIQSTQSTQFSEPRTASNHSNSTSFALPSTAPSTPGKTNKPCHPETTAPAHPESKIPKNPPKSSKAAKGFDSKSQSTGDKNVAHAADAINAVAGIDVNDSQTWSSLESQGSPQSKIFNVKSLPPLKQACAPRLPGWGDILALGIDDRHRAVADPETRDQLRAGAEQAAGRALGVLSDFSLMEVSDPGSAWVGRSLGEIAEARGTDVTDVLIDVVLVEGLTLFLVLPSLTPSLGRTDEGWRVRASVWKDRRVMLGGSDAGAHVDLMCHANYPTVVLGEAVRQRGLLSIEEAVAMMTDRPARHYGLRRRGRIAPGWHADLCIFDPAEVGSQPAELVRDLPGGGERLSARSLGVEHVFVAGREVVTGGKVTDARPGRVLRSGRDTDTVSLADVRR